MDQDTDGDGIIDNSGFADNTFDCWVVTGPRYGTSFERFINKYLEHLIDDRDAI